MIDTCLLARLALCTVLLAYAPAPESMGNWPVTWFGWTPGTVECANDAYGRRASAHASQGLPRLRVTDAGMVRGRSAARKPR